MKKTVTLLTLLVLAASSAFAGHRDADLRLSVFQNRAFTMTLNGLHYTRPDNAFVLRDLEPGRHWLEVRSANGRQVLYRGHIVLQPGTQVKARIDQRGRYVVKEVLAKATPVYGPAPGTCGTPTGVIHPAGPQPYGVYTAHPAGGGYVIHNAPAMGGAAFDALLRSLDAQRFDDARLAIARDVLSRHALTSTQLRRVLLEFSFDGSRLEAAKLGYPSLVDPQNVHVITDAFRFSSTTTAFYAWIG
jgi:hypothetical protein